MNEPRGIMTKQRYSCLLVFRCILCNMILLPFWNMQEVTNGFRQYIRRSVQDLMLDEEGDVFDEGYNFDTREHICLKSDSLGMYHISFSNQPITH